MPKNKFNPIPAWFPEAKFGIFVHWGPYAVPAAFNEWYPRNMYQPHMKEFAHHRKTWGSQGRFGYKDFIPKFKGGRFDAKSWARLFRRAGARYAVLSAEHHDSFAMYASSHTRWNSVSMGPRRDVLGEFCKAVRAQGLKAGASSHLAFNWWYFPKNSNFDTGDPAYADLYGGRHDVSHSLKPLPKKLWWDLFRGERPGKDFLGLWWKRCSEIIGKYRPSLLYFDWCWGQPEWDRLRLRLSQHYYKKVRDAALVYKEKALPKSAGIFDMERSSLSKAAALPWQADTSVSWKSWCHIKNDSFKSPASLIHLLCDVVSKNGNLLLNVGPRADGSIPAEAQRILKRIGDWLKVNGEAIYGTRPWKANAEGPRQAPEKESKKFRFTSRDIRYTCKGNAVYALVLGQPKGWARLQALGKEKVKSAAMLGSAPKTPWRQIRGRLEVKMPSTLPTKAAVAIKVILESPKSRPV